MVWQDLGGGVIDDGEGPVEPPVMRPAGEGPTCPCCGLRDTVERIESPFGAFDCRACTSLFDGTDAEWRRWRQRREAAVARRKELEEKESS